jgi:hypothetical protein
MEFGKREPRSPGLRPSQDGNFIDRTPRQAEPEGGFFDSKLGMLVGVVAVGLVGFLGASLAVGGLNGRVFGPVAALMAKIPARAGASAAKLDDDDKINARIATACMPSRSTNHDVVMMEEDDVESGRGWSIDELDKKSWVTLGAVPAYLDCAANTERRRFCKTSFRNQYAAQVTRYYRVIARLGLNSPVAASMARMDQMLNGDGNERGFGSPSVTTGGSNPITENPLIVRAVRELSRDGLLAKENFGWFGLSLPEEIAPHIEAPKRKLCP